MTLRLTRAALLAGTASALVIPCVARAQTATSPVKVGIALNDPYLEPYYARDQGFFASAGIDVTIETIANGGAIVQAAAANAIDVGVGELTQVVNAIDHGVPFSVFAGGAIHSPAEPTLVLCVAKNAPEKTAKDFEGKTVGITTLRSLPAAAVMLWLEKGGADLTKVKFFELPLSQLAPALARGTVTAALVGEPFITDAGDAIRQLAVPFDAVAPSFYIGCWYAKRDWLAKNGSTAKRFADAIYAAGRWANTHRPESAVIEAKYLQLDADKLKTMRRNTFATALDPKLMQPVLDLAVRYKMLAKPVAAGDVITRPA
jgi:NitT/TauT family transport system substrate-binding protein